MRFKKQARQRYGDLSDKEVNKQRQYCCKWYQIFSENEKSLSENREK